MFYIYLNASQYDNIYFRSPCFYVSNSALFLHSTLVLSFYIDVVLTLSIGNTVDFDEVLGTHPALLVLWGRGVLAHVPGLGCFFVVGFNKTVEQPVEQTIEIDDDAHVTSLWCPSRSDVSSMHFN